MEITAAGTLEERVAALEAVEQIKALKYRYLRACDRKDADAFRDCFVAEGASMDYGPTGSFEDRDALTAVFRNVGLAREGGRYVVLDMHHAMHPVIELLGEGRAKGAWTLRFRQVDRVAGTEAVSAIEYDDRYEVEDGRWRIRSSSVTVLWRIARPLPEGVSFQGRFA
ncbi:nuclear transport factor 2 family protein [Actinomadura sp. WMMB 499]|uniref:nuclear transport factor 2 family protein n=1 Tax=Actinomadura sp. WMMB 499 TaxID=1219491 RepID=UPI0012454EEC|nr:nuclear transport factor 2 family protein [Actinomadura sp. WMMB 499]QFG20107.1 nuclear transport factor 2 family protein [Actinomadura sp. WMMB 499]